MRPPVLLIASLLAFAASARAEVTVDLRALDALPGGPSAQADAPPQHPAHRAHHKPHTDAKAATTPPAQGPAAKNTPPGTEAGMAPSKGIRSGTAAGTTPLGTTPAGTTPAGTAARQAAPTSPATTTPQTPRGGLPPPAATVPTEPPPTAAIVPVAPPAPEAAPAPPPPPPIVAGAHAAASATANGLRVTFGKDVTDLSPASADQIKALSQSVPQGGTGSAETTSFEVAAYATGTQADPSTARRLSLSRALAVRSALIADGVPSARIYVRALGSQSGEGPADRVDLTVLGGNAGATTQAQ